MVQARAELLVPGDDIVSTSLVLLMVVRRRGELVVVLAILLDLFHDLVAYVLERDGASLSVSQIYTRITAQKQVRRSVNRKRSERAQTHSFSSVWAQQAAMGCLRTRKQVGESSRHESNLK